MLGDRSTKEEYLAWLEALAKDAREKFDKHMAQIDMMNEEAKYLHDDAISLEQAIVIIRRRLGLPVNKQQRERFHNMSIEEAAIVVTKEAGGEMKVSDIVKALRDNEKDLGKVAYGVVFTTLKRSNQFEKVGPGKYRLLNKS